ncbi:hypothetical protein AB8879_10625 [Alphaproteobacteria bacterium LSUCC0744]
MVQILIMTALVIASTRGALVYHFGASPDLSYQLSSVALALLGLFATLRMLTLRVHPELGVVKKVFQLNIMLIGAYWSIFMVFSFIKYVNILFYFILFPVVFILIGWSKKKLETILHVIFAVTAGGIIMIQVIGLNDFQEFYRIQAVLRPDSVGIPNFGGIAQINGYQASNHDASNILVMICMYYFVQLYISGFRINLWLFSGLLTGIFALLLAASASNITVFIGGLLFFVLFAGRGIVRKLVFVWMACLLGWILVVVEKQYFDLFHFLDKFQVQILLSEHGMLQGLNLGSLYGSLVSILIGFGYQLEVPMVDVEVAYVKILVAFGVIPTLVLLYVLFLPLILLRNATKVTKRLGLLVSDGDQSISTNRVYRDRLCLIGFAAPVIVGSLTLLHYGSLFKVTSIGLFCVLLSIFLKEYLSFMIKYASMAPKAREKAAGK